MTTPSVNLGLDAHIQTEFGGARPVAMSEYYRGGAYVPGGTPVSAVDGTSIPFDNTPHPTIRMGMFRSLQKMAAGVQPTGGFSSICNVGIGVSGQASVSYGPDGGVTSFTTNGNTVLSVWYNPLTANIGNSYYIRHTNNGADAPTMGLENTWSLMSSAQAIGFRNTTANKYGSWTTQISTTSNGSNIVATYTTEAQINHA